jgi:hypothetical protein
MNTHTEPRARGRNGGGESRTESTAVFLGRASFRMIPGPRVLQDPQSYEHHQPWDLESSSATPRDWNIEAEETVILSQADADPHTQASPWSEDAREIACDVTYEWPSPQRRSLPFWAIAAALLVGATLTFSANAMMRRPARQVTASKPAAAVSRAIAAPKTVRPRTPIAPAIVPPTMASPPIVVPVLTSLPEENDRAAHASPRREPAKRVRKRGHYNDPFDNKPVTRAATVAAPAGKVMPASETTETIPAPAIAAPETAPEPAVKPVPKTTWVDPFAN